MTHGWPGPRSLRLLTVAVGSTLVALAGCLEQLQDEQAHASSACDLLWHPGQSPSDAPSEAGPGPRQVDVQVLGGDSQPIAHMTVVAWWQETPDEIHVLRLTTSEMGATSDQSGKVVLHVPADQDVEILAGSVEWTHEGHLAAGPDPVSMSLTAGSVLGSVDGHWSSTLAEGVSGAVWQPNDLPWADDDHMARLERLDLTLLWTNGPQGGADFGIGVGPASGSDFHYTNREYQTTVGPQGEQRTLEKADLDDLGWDASTRPQAGPSVSTGGFAVTEIPYTLVWEATFAVDPDLDDRCLSLGDVDAFDVTSGGDAAASGPATATVTASATASATSTVHPSRQGRVD